MRFMFSPLSYIIENMEKKLRISALTAQKKKRDRYNVSIDGEYAASLGAEACARYGIRAGAAVDEEAFLLAVRDDNTRYAFDSAAAMLAHKPRTRAEIEKKLLEKGIVQDAVDAAIEKLQGYGYINDAEYAREYVRSAVRAGKWGRRTIEYRLQSLGLEGDIIEAAMHEYTDTAEKEIARSHYLALSAKYKNDQTKRQKIYGALMRRGFDCDIISALLSGDDAD